MTSLKKGKKASKCFLIDVQKQAKIVVFYINTLVSHLTDLKFKSQKKNYKYCGLDVKNRLKRCQML